MKITVLDDDLIRRVYDVDALVAPEKSLTLVDSSSKEHSILDIYKAYKYGHKAILFDETNTAIKRFLANHPLEAFASMDFFALMFTSGTTGTPVGAFKTRENLDKEVDFWCRKMAPYTIKKVIPTVPFIHIYGILTAVLLPYQLGAELFFKEHFLPRDLLEAIEPHTLVVTTPLYIKSLLRLDETRSLKDVVFMSSTGPLSEEDAKAFIEKFDTNLIQLFGSTETGGIAYKEQVSQWWTPLENVTVDTNEEQLLRTRSPYISQMLYDKGFKETGGVIQSFDYVEFQDNTFKIIGRSSQIFKVAGKRFSTLQVEELLESMDAIEKAYVSIDYVKGELKDEKLHLFLQTKEKVDRREIKKLLYESFGKITFPLKVSVVEKIPTTALGKKMMPI